MFDQSPNDGPSVLTYDNIKEGANEGQDRPDNRAAHAFEFDESNTLEHQATSAGN